ncbi:MAG: DUF4179 domain-containing protein, partial [Eggerthella sp.]|nr:DUF4179 domain-containing protein [Eggerthella sp.]
MIDEYKEALDELRFSPEAKRRMAQRIEAVAAAEPLPRPTRRSRALVIAAAAAVLALAVGCTAYASGMLGRASAPAKETPATTEVVDGIGRPDAHASSDGVTVTAEAVMGDRSNYAIVFSIAKDDGTPFEGIRENQDGTFAI